MILKIPENKLPIEEQKKRKELIDFIIENADKEWWHTFVFDVVEPDYPSWLHDFDTESLEKFTKEVKEAMG